jgi:hypothetical protein
MTKVIQWGKQRELLHVSARAGNSYAASRRPSAPSRDQPGAERHYDSKESGV